MKRGTSPPLECIPLAWPLRQLLTSPSQRVRGEWSLNFVNFESREVGREASGWLGAMS